MERLREDIRAAFVRQQERLGDVSGLSHVLVREAMAGMDRNRARLRQTAAGGLAALLTAAVVGTLIAVRANAHPTTHPAARPVTAPTAAPSEAPAPTAAPTPKTTALTQQLQVSAGTPVILFTDPADHQQLDGITWDGQTAGRVAPKATRYGVLPNPSGSLYVDGTDFKDRSGQVVGHYTTPTKGFGTWADDSQHYCEMVNPGGGNPAASGEPTTLQVAAPGQSPRRVVTVGTVSQQTFVRVAACSITGDRAVVVQSAGQGVSTAQYWVVQLSTGRILWTHSFTPGASMIQVVAAPNAQYIAETSYVAGQQANTTNTTVYGAGGLAVGHVSLPIVAFSWDGSLAVSDDYYGHVAVINWLGWKPGSTPVWTGPDGLVGHNAFPEPNGQRMAIVVAPKDPPFAGGITPADLYVIGPDGQARKLVSSSPSIG